MRPLFLPLLLLVSVVSLGSGCGSGNSSAAGGSGAPGAAGVVPPYPTPDMNGTIQGEGNFARLIQRFSQGRASSTPWAGYWWPYAQSGISDAASLYERAHGASGATSWERTHHGPNLPNLQDWFGHCNGWAAAAVLYPEPRQGTSASGVTFSVGDQKQLLSEIAMEVSADFFGLRNSSNNPTDPSFQDVSPDVFFLVLANYVGNGAGLVIDRYTGDQVWNQAVAGYRIDPVTREDYLGPAQGAPNVHRVTLSTQVWWARDDVPGEFVSDAFDFQDNGSYESRVFRYEVWLDAPPVFDSSGALQSSGNVIVARQGNTAVGGAWRNTNLDPLNSHPDYIWVPHSATPSSGYSNPNLDLAWVQSNFGRR